MDAFCKSGHLGISVVWLADYPSRRSWRTTSHDCHYLIRALKRSSAVRLNDRLNRRCHLDTRTVEQALKWFGTLAALIIRTQKLYPHCVLVPIPDSSCVRGELRAPRTLRLAEAIAGYAGAACLVADVVRWTRSCQPSHLGGCRDPKSLQRELEIMSVPPSGTIVLVDDVVTSGAHILAAAALFKNVGFECKHAICVARTTSSPEPAFAIGKTVLFGHDQNPEAVGHPAGWGLSSQC
jgi:predicted amidophosphoribosyltransferase